MFSFLVDKVVKRLEMHTRDLLSSKICKRESGAKKWQKKLEEEAKSKWKLRLSVLLYFPSSFIRPLSLPFF